MKQNETIISITVNDWEEHKEGCTEHFSEFCFDITRVDSDSPKNPYVILKSGEDKSQVRKSLMDESLAHLMYMKEVLSTPDYWNKISKNK